MQMRRNLESKARWWAALPFADEWSALWGGDDEAEGDGGPGHAGAGHQAGQVLLHHPATADAVKTKIVMLALHLVPLLPSYIFYGSAFLKVTSCQKLKLS